MPSPTDPILLINLFRVRIQQLETMLEDLDVPAAAADEGQWERLIFSGAELVSAYRALVRARGGSARQRILHYLQAHVGETIDGEVLASIAGISEWARRVRELDVEQGYSITTNDTDPGLRPGQYRLEAAEPDAERAAWRRLKKDLRGDSNCSVHEKVIALLTQRVGRVVDSADLRYAVEPHDPVPAVLDLRHLDGWQISSHAHRADLGPAQYLLETTVQVPPPERLDARSEEGVLRRDAYACRNCRWCRTDPPSNGRRYLTVQRRTESYGPATAENCEVLCNRCRDERLGQCL